MELNKSCEIFKCKDYKVVCNSCIGILCGCNPICEKCIHYKKTCSGSKRR